MSQIKDITGQRFGRLVAVKFLRLEHGAVWLCKCDCGTRKQVWLSNLGRNIVSCGCLRREKASKRLLKHGEHGTLEYVSWKNMLNRCTKPDCEKYSRYGARGIKVWDRWMSVTNFIEDMGRKPSPQHTIERDNPDGDYCPENCKWVLREENTSDYMHGRLTKRAKEKLDGLGVDYEESPLVLSDKVMEGLRRGGKVRAGKKKKVCDELGCFNKCYRQFCKECRKKKGFKKNQKD